MNEETGKYGPFSLRRDPATVSGFLIALCAFLVFSGTLGHKLVWDDIPVVLYAQKVVEEGGVGNLLTAPFAMGVQGLDNPTGYYRPVSLISMWVNSPFEEPSPFPYHLTNVLLHVINSLLLFQVLTLLLPRGPGPLLGSLLFAVHPVHSESVAFVSGRTDLLAALFVLLTVLLWQRYGQTDSPPSRTRFFLGMATFSLACLSKEVAFVLPILLLLWTSVAAPRVEGPKGAFSWKRNNWAFGMLVVLAALLSLRFLVLNIHAGPGWSRYAQVGDASLVALAGEVVRNISQYLRLMVFPWPLAVFYPPTETRLTWMAAGSAAAFVAVCLALSGQRHRRIGLVSLLWTILFLVPVSGIVGLGQSVIADRFCYLPSVGVVAVLGYALALLREKITVKRLHTALVVGVLLLFGLGSVLHAARWKDDRTLFTSALESSPSKIPTMYMNLGLGYKDLGENELAVQAFEEALRADPALVPGLLNLGVIQREMGHFEKALESFDKARMLLPEDPSVWFQRGLVLEEMGRSEEALDAYTRTAVLDPGKPVAYYQKGKLLAQLGRYEESIAAYGEAVRIDKNHAGAHVGLGRSYEAVGRTGEAIQSFLKAIEVQPDLVIAYEDLGRVLLQTGRIAEAVKVFEMATALDPLDQVAGKGLVLAYLRAGEKEKARQYIRGLDPANAGFKEQLSALMDSLTGHQDP